MDRQTFRKIVLKSAFQKRKMYESFLENVSLLKHLEVSCSVICRTYSVLQRYERENIADSLVTKTFTAGQEVVEQVATRRWL